MNLRSQAALDVPPISQNEHDITGLAARARALHRRGQVTEAHALYRKLLENCPGHFEALYMLGVCERQRGNFDAAERLQRLALLINPGSPAAHCELGLTLQDLNRPVEALACFDRVVELKPDFTELPYKRGNALLASGRLDDAIGSFDQMIALDPSHVSAWNNRGNALRQRGQLEQAIASYDQALTRKPAHISALINRGATLVERRQARQGMADFDRSLALDPDNSVAWAHKAQASRILGNLEDAIASCDKALSINPDLALAWIVCSAIQLTTGKIDEAKASCERALAIAPKNADALTQLGQCLLQEADADAALLCFDRALAIRPDDEFTLSCRIFALDFSPTSDFASHQAARSLWWERIGMPIAETCFSSNGHQLSPNKKIILGYVSGDFRHHSAAYTFRPVLQNHDRSNFEVICYYSSSVEDSVTRSFKALADRWRDTQSWSDDQLAQCIRTDRVDILIDLSGHTVDNRLRVFARKPAPVQVTAWGHATGTGLNTIDYLFSDPVLVPAEMRHLFAEQIHDLPCAITIEPIPATFRCAEPPVTSNGYLTYGIFNRISKISSAAIAVWAQILKADVRARLMIKDFGIDVASVRSGLRERFASHGIAPDRLQLIGSTSREDHLAAYANVDICLDPFPQGGGVSTWEALYMGVPVVAKLGDAVPKRLGGAILSAIGLSDWVASDDDQYVDIARRATPDRLRTLRQKLPEMISTRCGPVAYAKAVEAAYQAIWRKHCGAITE
jgi:predicted O-linked N-acetylglucosamine transferase (SPINDLY family)